VNDVRVLVFGRIVAFFFPHKLRNYKRVQVISFWKVIFLNVLGCC
jgi:hypothetical protein